jgi:hypothetical protein
MPLTQEQFQKARAAGFTTEQIVGFEKRRSPEVKQEPIFKTEQEGRSASQVADKKMSSAVGKAELLQKATDVAAVPYHFLNQYAFNAPRAISNTIMPGAGEEIARSGGAAAKVAGVAGGVLSPLNKFMLFQKAGLGAKAVAGAAQGALYTPDQDIVGLKQRGIQAAVGGALGPATDLISRPVSRFLSTNAEKASRAVGKASKLYREVLRPKQSEVRKIEIGYKKDINDYYKLAAKEGLVIEPDVDGTISTEAARSQLSEKVGALNQQMDDILSTDTTKKFNLDDISAKAKVAINEKFKSAIERKAARKKIDEIIKAEKVDAKGNLVSGAEVNKIKEAMWGMGYNAQEPSTDIIARKIGHVIKEEIESGYADKAIKELNKTRGDYLTLNTLLVNAHGRKINYGHIGKMVASGAGAIAGRQIPIIGPFVGSHIGKTAIEAASNPERMSKMAASLAKKYQGPESKFMQFLRKNLITEVGSGSPPSLRSNRGELGASRSPRDFATAEKYVASKMKLAKELAAQKYSELSAKADKRYNSLIGAEQGRTEYANEAGHYAAMNDQEYLSLRKEAEKYRNPKYPLIPSKSQLTAEFNAAKGITKDKVPQDMFNNVNEAVDNLSDDRSSGDEDLADAAVKAWKELFPRVEVGELDSSISKGALKDYISKVNEIYRKTTGETNAAKGEKGK